MNRTLLLFLAITNLCFGQNVPAVGEKVLETMEKMSASWKLVKDQQSARAQGKRTQTLAKTLSQLAEELQQYPRPDNATRTQIKASRANRIEKTSMEMAETLVLLQANAPLMAAFASELAKIKPAMDASNKIFTLYFEPDSAK